MPATSSAASVVVAAVPPMANYDGHNIDRQNFDGQEAESVEDSSSSSSTIAIQQIVCIQVILKLENILSIFE